MTSSKVQTAVAATIKMPLPDVQSEAEIYAAHRVFIQTAAQTVIRACAALADTERKVRNDWWTVLRDVASKCAPGNAQQFSREYDMVRQEILDDLAKLAEDGGRFTPTAKAESLAAKWRELEVARSGFSTFANYASQCRFWVEKVKASVDLAQSPESFGMTVRNYYTESKAADKKAAEGTGSGQRNKPEVVQTEDGETVAVTAGLASSAVRFTGPDGKLTTEMQSFTPEIIAAMQRLSGQVGAALHQGVPPVKIVEALKVAHDMIGDAKTEAKAATKKWMAEPAKAEKK